MYLSDMHKKCVLVLYNFERVLNFENVTNKFHPFNTVNV